MLKINWISTLLLVVNTIIVTKLFTGVVPDYIPALLGLSYAWLHIVIWPITKD